MIRDVTSWEIDDKRIASGKLRKFWLIDRNSESRYLLKFSREDTGETWSEKVSSDLGNLMGLNVVDVEIVRYKDSFAAMIKNFRELSYTLYEGGDLFDSKFNNFNRRESEHYTLKNILDLLNNLSTSLIEEFLNIPFFDALIGNQDRHCENWGILHNTEGDYVFAPIYDNGASLGFQLKLEKVEQYMKNNESLQRFINRSYSLILTDGKYKKNAKYNELIPFICRRYPEIANDFKQRLICINDMTIDKILISIQDEIMNIKYKEWVHHLLLSRKLWLENLIEEGLK